MFTGLIADLGVLHERELRPEGARLSIQTALSPEIKPGDSVAVNGVCLTATAVSGGAFEVELMNQTLTLTSLAPLGPGDRVNVELAMRASDRLGGHIVQGHVDGTAAVVSVTEDGFSRRLRISVAPELMRYVVEHGSITLDGVSLTVSALAEDWLEVSLIPETLERTNLGGVEEGHVLNVEFDVLAKHVERLLSPLQGKEGPSS